MTSDHVRLHITPLSPDLLKTVLGPAAYEKAQNVSYHQIQTFPEKNFGYVDLPREEANKVKKKLNGAMLKGSKIKIDEARPKKRTHVEVEASDKPRAQPAEAEAKSSKADLNGRELSPDRKVKRGWTEAKKSKKDKKDKKLKDKSNQQKSKYTDKDELLFRTTLPASKVEKKTEKDKKKKRKAQVVHEFEKNTTQPSFLKETTSEATPNLHYVDGEGWANDAGEIVEAESKNLKARRSLRKTITKGKAEEIKATEEESESEESSASSAAPKTPGSVPNEEDAAKDQPDVHPLEALFKKPKKPASSQDTVKPSLELATSNFSFFEGENDADNDIEEDYGGVPLTPFSSQDMRSRGLRSAAPTPDTAHPSRFNSYGSTGLPGDEVMEDDDDSEVEAEAGPSSKAKPVGLVSDFEKMFWEKRGDNNRAWKARRRAVLKDKRQRENRARRPKNW
jgi:hypothetical protein